MFRVREADVSGAIGRKRREDLAQVEIETEIETNPAQTSDIPLNLASRRRSIRLRVSPPRPLYPTRSFLENRSSDEDSRHRHPALIPSSLPIAVAREGRNLGYKTSSKLQPFAGPAFCSHTDTTDLSINAELLEHFNSTQPTTAVSCQNLDMLNSYHTEYQRDASDSKEGTAGRRRHYSTSTGSSGYWTNREHSQRTCRSNSAVDDRLQSSTNKATLRLEEKFIWKLWLILKGDSEGGDFSEWIHWTADGKYFVVPDETALVENVCKVVFNQSSITSFNKQCNNWDFKREHDKTHALRSEFNLPRASRLWYHTSLTRDSSDAQVAEVKRHEDGLVRKNGGRTRPVGGKSKKDSDPKACHSKLCRTSSQPIMSTLTRKEGSEPVSDPELSRQNTMALHLISTGKAQIESGVVGPIPFSFPKKRRWDESSIEEEGSDPGDIGIVKSYRADDCPSTRQDYSRESNGEGKPQSNTIELEYEPHCFRRTASTSSSELLTTHCRRLNIPLSNGYKLGFSHLLLTTSSGSSTRTCSTLVGRDRPHTEMGQRRSFSPSFTRSTACASPRLLNEFNDEVVRNKLAEGMTSPLRLEGGEMHESVEPLHRCSKVYRDEPPSSHAARGLLIDLKQYKWHAKSRDQLAEETPNPMPDLTTCDDERRDKEFHKVTSQAEESDTATYASDLSVQSSDSSSPSAMSTSSRQSWSEVAADSKGSAKVTPTRGRQNLVPPWLANVLTVDKDPLDESCEMDRLTIFSAFPGSRSGSQDRGTST